MDREGERTRLIGGVTSSVAQNPSPRRQQTYCIRRARALSKLIPLGPIILSSVLFAIVICILFFTGRNADQFADPELGVDSKLHLRWGVVGLGRITSDFTVALRMIGADLEAVGAGALPDSTKRAVEFGQKFGLPKSKCYGSYEELAADPKVDIVYIGNTNQLHYKTALIMIAAGKHVLVEKPTALTGAETRAMITAAKEKGVLLTTNFWTRYFPAILFAREQMRAGCIGDIVGLRGDFGFQASPDTQDRYFNAVTGGGALMDMGCYLVHFATMAMADVHQYKAFLDRWSGGRSSDISTNTTGSSADNSTSSSRDMSEEFALRPLSKSEYLTSGSEASSLPYPKGSYGDLTDASSRENSVSSTSSPDNMHDNVMRNGAASEMITNEKYEKQGLLRRHSGGGGVSGNERAQLVDEEAVAKAFATYGMTMSAENDDFNHQDGDSSGGKDRRSVFRLPERVLADGLVAADGVDVETSFILSWESDIAPTRSTSRASPSAVEMLVSGDANARMFRGLNGVFSTSLRRGSPFNIEIMGTHGFINIDSPANCPMSSTVNVGRDAYHKGRESSSVEFEFPTQRLCAKNSIGPNPFRQALPIRPAQYGPSAYPGTTGFVYVIQAMDQCLQDHRTGKGGACMEMPDLTSEEQIVIMDIIDAVREKIAP